MEEILASIRKIIAEDASGPRPPPSPPRTDRLTQTPGPSAQAQPQRGFMSREAFLHSSKPAESETTERYFKPVNPANPETATEPAAAPRSSQDAKADTDRSKAAEASTSSAAAKSESKSATFDAAKKADTKTTTDAEAKRASVPARIEPQSEAASIEAQLTELLDHDLKALREAQNGHVHRLTDIEDAEATPVTTRDAPSEQGPVSHHNGASAPANETSDPFAFDLGPSPFLSRARPESPVEQRPAEPRQAAPQPSAPAPHHQPIHQTQTPYGSARHGMNGATPASTSPFKQPSAPPPARHEPSRSEAPPFSGAVPRPGAPFVVPSVSATLGPHRTLEPLSASFQPAPRERQFDSSQPRQTALSSEAGRDRLEAMLQPASSEATGIERAVEDAVADLLRPLLKTWLAENMPKIVERALRREMSERLLPGQKNSRD
jgi:cell pole-organizing protein PopZ